MFSEKLKNYRIDHKLTQKELAAILGVAEITVRQYENNKRKPSTDDVEKFARKLGMNPADLDDRLAIKYSGKLYVVDETNEFVFLCDGDVLTVKGTMPKEEFEECVSRGEMSFDDLVHYRETKTFDFIEPPKQRICAAFDKLNDDGQRAAIDRVEELTEIPKYQK